MSRICKHFEITRSIYANREWSKQFFKQNAFSTYSWRFLKCQNNQSSNLAKISNWDSETCRKRFCLFLGFRKWHFLLTFCTTTRYLCLIENTEGEGVKKEGENAYVIYEWSLKCPLPRKTDFSGPRSNLKMQLQQGPTFQTYSRRSAGGRQHNLKGAGPEKKGNIILPTYLSM